MTKPDDRTRLNDIIRYAGKAHDYLTQAAPQERESSELLQIALARLAEIVGEAANNLSESIRHDHPEIEWSELIGMRVLIAHNYNRVDPSVVDDVIANDFPVLIQVAGQILSELPT